MARRGRKRLVKRRQPNGQPWRAPEHVLAEEAMSVALNARTRVYGLPCGLVRHQEAGDAFGRAFMRDSISRSEHEAGLEYESLYRQWVKVALIRPFASSADLNRSSGYDGGDGDDPLYVEHCRLVSERIDGSRRALERAGPLCRLAVETWVVEQRAAWGLLKPLRSGLWALARLYRIRDVDTRYGVV